jgi:hypothetical protein
VSELEDAVMEESDKDGEEEVVSLSLSDMELVEDMVAIPVPGLSVIHTLVPVEFIPPLVCNSPSPPYVQHVEDDLSYDGVLEYWVDPDV